MLLTKAIRLRPNLRQLAYLATSLPSAGIAATALFIAIAPIPMVGKSLPEPNFAILLITAIAVALAPIAALPLAAWERWRLRLVDPQPLETPRFPGLYTNPAAWRPVAYAVWLGGIVPLGYGILALLAVFSLALVGSPWLASTSEPINILHATADSPAESIPFAAIGVIGLLALWWLLGPVAAVQATVARRLLGAPVDEAALREVTRSRARLVDVYEAERHRIERDLHDGAQPRLTSLTLHIGMARHETPDGTPAAKPLDIAQEQAKGLMVMLRQIVHGIRPQSLTDLGLAGAVMELADQSGVRTTVQNRLSQRLPDAVEATAYFAVSEALANVARHARASRAEVRLIQERQTLMVEVEDDGIGGANPKSGSGLTGLADRVGAANGRLLLASPVGGPTLVRVELPCQR